jgi:hypothetical protein
VKEEGLRGRSLSPCLSSSRSLIQAVSLHETDVAMTKGRVFGRLPENGGAEEAEEIAAAGETEAGDEVRLGHGGAPQDSPALQHGDGSAGAGEVRGGDESVVAAADHHSIPSLTLGQLRRRRGRRSLR